MLYEKLENRNVKCNVCNHYCIIPNGKRGVCGVRENKEGTLYSLNFGKTIAYSIDPIEKKPLYQYLSNTDTYSFASVGCNLDCPWCQNNSISQSPKKYREIEGQWITPKTHVEIALKYRCPSVSYTYSEPTVFLEYALKTMILAQKEGLKNIWVTNGNMSIETRETIMPYVDALNIDFKGNELIFTKYRLGKYYKVLENMKAFQDNGKHIEITILLIPDITLEVATVMISDLMKYVSLDTPLHFTRCFPNYKMTTIKKTPRERMNQIYIIAKEHGFTNVYLGNI